MIDTSINQPFHIAIDGYSSCGKSTLAKDLSSHFKWIHVDTGMMYRAITYYLINNGIQIDNANQISDALERLTFEVVVENLTQQIRIDNALLQHQLRSSAVDRSVSQVAQHSQVRRFLVAKQQDLAARTSMIMDGRDIGTVVLPNAQVKIFVQADLDVRSKRRWLELRSSNQEISLDDIRYNLEQRDKIDTARTDSPLTLAPDAILLDTTNLTRVEQMKMVAALISERKSM